MKTIIYTYRINRIIILISMFMLMMSFTAIAQSRSRNGDNNRSRNSEVNVRSSSRTTVDRSRNNNARVRSSDRVTRERTTAVQSRTYSSRDAGSRTQTIGNTSRNERNSLNYHEGSRSRSNQGRYIERNEKPAKHSYTYKSAGHKHNTPAYSIHKYHTKHYVYVHPHTHIKYYYYSPWTYYNYPVVFYHNDFGEYYLHDGRFWRFDWQYGYYVVDLPTHMYFHTLPAGYHRVHYMGRVYYRYHDIYFRYTPYGYRIVPRSAGIYIHARF